jgi:adenine-specific DNA-methyltransferase
MAKKPAASNSPAASAAIYEHADEAVQRPDVGLQQEFMKARKPPKQYRYDSSLDPALSWDENPGREQAEWLLGLIERCAGEGEAAVFAEEQTSADGRIRVGSLKSAVAMLKTLSRPFLDWAGKAERAEIRVPTLPLFVHERHSTKAIIDGLASHQAKGRNLDLFGDAQLDLTDKLRAYEHRGPWVNRMILGDSLTVMNSLLEYEGLGGSVQMIYIDPPYGVKFGSNFQPFVRKRDVKHGADDQMTREPEMVKAYRDTWELGLHSYLSYLRDRLLLARELLTESGSVFVQISDDNLHHVREVMDEVFRPSNVMSIITIVKTSAQESDELPAVCDYLIWYAKNKESVKYNKNWQQKEFSDAGASDYNKVELPDGSRRRMTQAEIDDWNTLPEGSKIYTQDNIVSQRPPGDFPVDFEGETFKPITGYWKTGELGMSRLIAANRIEKRGRMLRYVRFFNDFPFRPISNFWPDVRFSSRVEEKLYAVQTSAKAIQRCLLMTTDPGDLVLDPTCGSGTTAYVAEHWGRRWITIDTSRVPLALARQRLLTATFPFYALQAPALGPRGGFVYVRKQNRKGEEIGGLVPHITLKSIANNEPPAMETLVDRPEVMKDVTRVTGPFTVEALMPAAQALSVGSSQLAVEEEGDFSDHWPLTTDNCSDNCSDNWQLPTDHYSRMIRVLKLSRTLRLPGNRSLEFEHVRALDGYDTLHAEAEEQLSVASGQWPVKKTGFTDNSKLTTDNGNINGAKLSRVKGVAESHGISPTNVSGDKEFSERGNIRSGQPNEEGGGVGSEQYRGRSGADDQGGIPTILGAGAGIAAGTGNPSLAGGETGVFGCPESTNVNSSDSGNGPTHQRTDRLPQKLTTDNCPLTTARVAIVFGPEDGAIGSDTVYAAAEEAKDAGFGKLYFFGFAIQAKAREMIEDRSRKKLPCAYIAMTPDVAMSDLLKTTRASEIFSVTGLPDVDVVKLKEPGPEGKPLYQVRLKGLDIFNPATLKTESVEGENLPCWMLDTDYDNLCFFATQVFFPKTSAWDNLQKSLKAEFDPGVWEHLAGVESEPFELGEKRRIAVKVIDERGNELMVVRDVKPG